MTQLFEIQEKRQRRCCQVQNVYFGPIYLHNRLSRLDLKVKLPSMASKPKVDDGELHESGEDEGCAKSHPHVYCLKVGNKSDSYVLASDGVPQPQSRQMNLKLLFGAIGIDLVIVLPSHMRFAARFCLDRPARRLPAA